MDRPPTDHVHVAESAQIQVLDAVMNLRQKQFALFVLLALIAAGVLLTPLANTKLMPVPGYMTAFGAAMLVSNLLLAALLYSRGATEGRAATIQLGTAYFFVGMIFLPLMMAFPGGLVAGSLIGEPVSPV